MNNKWQSEETFINNIMDNTVKNGMYEIALTLYRIFDIDKYGIQRNRIFGEKKMFFRWVKEENSNFPKLQCQKDSFSKSAFDIDFFILANTENSDKDSFLNLLLLNNSSMEEFACDINNGPKVFF